MKPPLATRVPVVLDEFLRLVRADATFNVEGVSVVDGSFGELENDMVYVGPGSEDQGGVTSSFEQLPGLGNAYVETIEVTLSISSYSGDVEMKPRRDRVNVLVAALQALVRQHQVHTGFWDSARFGPDWEWAQVQGNEGAVCAVGCTIVFRSAI